MGICTPRIYFCIQSPTGEVCEDENNRPFRMTAYHWEQWKLNGQPQQIRFSRLQLPTNPAKPLQAGWAFLSFTAAGWMLRQLQFHENEKSNWDKLAHEREQVIAELDTQIEVMEVSKELELSACDNAVVIQQAELLGEVEIKLSDILPTLMLRHRARASQ